MRNRFRTWILLKLKTSSKRAPIHVIEVSVLPSSNRSVVPTSFVGSPTQATPKSMDAGWRNVSDTIGKATTPALKSTVAEQAPSLVLVMNSST